MSAPTRRPFISASAAARRLEVGLSTLWSMSVAGEIPSIKVCRCRLYDEDDLEAWITERKKRSAYHG